MPDQPNPAEALEDIRRAREQVLERMSDSPWWYDAGFALSVGLMIAGLSFSTIASLLCTGAGLLLLGVIVRLWTDRTGVWVSGYKPRRARWVAFGLAGLYLVLALLSLNFGRLQGHWWVGLLLGAVAGAVAVIASRIWIRVYLAEMRDGQ